MTFVTQYRIQNSNICDEKTTVIRQTHEYNKIM